MSNIRFDARSNLNAVFDIYRTAGVLDEAVIIENIAFFALYWYFRKEIGDGPVVEIRDRHVSFRKVSYELERVLQKRGSIHTREQTLIPSPPLDMREDQQMNVFHLLREIFENTPSQGEWFDKELMPRLSSSPKGGRYATPRHLVRFMAGIVGLNSNDTIADFACGTGGMLVANGLVQGATGIEISPNMARLALTNLILHGQIQYDLYLGNAFDVASQNSQFIESKFDVIVMNPPFGARIDLGLVSQAFQKTRFFYDFKGGSETLFTALAYEKLTPGGRMAVLAPSGMLFSNNRGEEFLRRMLVEEGALQAVVSLPRDSMQPINNLTTHVLYAIKPQKGETKRNGLWFYRPRYDGFTSGRNRQPDPEHDDLPLVEAAIVTEGMGESVQIASLLSASRILGFRVESHKSADFRVTRMWNSFLIDALQESESVELIYAEGIMVDHSEATSKYIPIIYRGPSRLQAVPIQTPSKQPFTGKFVLTDASLANRDSKYSLGLENGVGEIRKGIPTKAAFGVSSKDEQDAIGVLLDSGKKAISPPVKLKTDDLGPVESSFLYRLSSEDKSIDGTLLLILHKGLVGFALASSTNQIRYLISHSERDKIAVFYEPAQNNFYFHMNSSNPGPFEDVIFNSDPSKRGVMFDLRGAILGISISRDAILSTKGAELQWEKYWEEKRQVTETRSTAQMLGDIKRNQNKLTSTLDRLLSISETRAVASTELPPRIHVVAPSQDLMQGIQQSIWDLVLQQVEQAGDYETPTAFQADDIHSKLTNNASVMDVQRTLELFERMGLIVSVTYEGVPYYRLPTERDIVKEAGK